VESNPTNAVLEFAADVEQVEVRIAVSAVSQEAADDIAVDWSDKSFDKLLKEARQQWREKLNQIQVKGSTEDQRTIFYTLLYRVYLSPMDVTTNDGRYKATDGKIYKADGFNYYSSWSMWDSFRTKFPLLTIVEPEAMSDIVMSLLHQYRTGKDNWATPHESVPTVRTEHSGVVILDAWKKGIRNVDLKVGYEGLKREAAKDLLYRTPDQRLESSYDFGVRIVSEVDRISS
jgi:putative alpha-1,2-mannosidase